VKPAIVNENHRGGDLCGDLADGRAFRTGIGHHRKIQAVAGKVGAAVVTGFMGQVGEHDDIGVFFNVEKGFHGTIDGLHGQGAFGKELHHGFLAVLGAERRQVLALADIAAEQHPRGIKFEVKTRQIILEIPGKMHNHLIHVANDEGAVGAQLQAGNLVYRGFTNH
jgi:hypothetical protein